MASFDSFEFFPVERMLEEVSPDEVPGCPKALALKHIRKAAIDFCRRSQWWMATLDPITAVAGITDYELDDVPDDVRAGSVVWIKLNGRELAAHEYELMDDGRGIILTNAPGETVRGGLEVRAVLEPARDFKTLESHLFNEWAPVIAAGALGALRRIPGRKWSSPPMAAFNAQEFENGIVRAKNQVMRARKNVNVQQSARRFAI